MPHLDDDFDDDWDIDKILHGDNDGAPRDIVDTPRDKHTFDGSVCPKCGHGIIHGLAAPGGDSPAERHIDGALQAFVEALPPWMRGAVRIMHAEADEDGNPIPPRFGPARSGFHPGRNLADIDEDSWSRFLESTVTHNGNAPLLRSLYHIVSELTDQHRITQLWQFYMLEHKMMVFSSMSEATRLFFELYDRDPDRAQNTLTDADIEKLRHCHDDLVARQRLLYEEYCEISGVLGIPAREEFSDPQTLCLYGDDPVTTWTALSMLGYRLEDVVMLKELRDERPQRETDG